MDCFNHNCPFRVNEISLYNKCDSIACPNRYKYNIELIYRFGGIDNGGIC